MIVDRIENFYRSFSSVFGIFSQGQRHVAIFDKNIIGLVDCRNMSSVFHFKQVQCLCHLVVINGSRLNLIRIEPTTLL